MEWLSQLIPGNAPDGAPILAVLGKRTYSLKNGAVVKVAEVQEPFLEADVYPNGGNPQFSSVLLESDLVAYKPMTDIIVIAKAHSPHGRAVKSLDVGVQVGSARKIARVFGNRKAFVTLTGISFSEPEPFTEMALDYSKAYGGKDLKSLEGSSFTYLKNPVGVGFIVKNNPKAIQDLVLPNIEDPQNLLTPQNVVLGDYEKWKLNPDPAGFGYTNKGFYPRYTLAGLPYEHWVQAEADRKQSQRQATQIGSKGTAEPSSPAPLLNPQFFNGASKGLAIPFLKGNETFRLANLDPHHSQFSFTLPGVRPKAWLNVGQGPETLEMVLHTVVVHKENDTVTLVWRACAYYRGLEAMKKFTHFEFGVKEESHG